MTIYNDCTTKQKKKLSLNIADLGFCKVGPQKPNAFSLRLGKKTYAAKVLPYTRYTIRKGEKLKLAEKVSFDYTEAIRSAGGN